MPRAKKPQKKGTAAQGTSRLVAPEVKLKAVKLFVEECLPRELICKQLGVTIPPLNKELLEFLALKCAYAEPIK